MVLLETHHERDTYLSLRTITAFEIFNVRVRQCRDAFPGIAR